jgi:hypothetical protein
MRELNMRESFEAITRRPFIREVAQLTLKQVINILAAVLPGEGGPAVPHDAETIIDRIGNRGVPIMYGDLRSAKAFSSSHWLSRLLDGGADHPVRDYGSDYVEPSPPDKRPMISSPRSGTMGQLV